MVDSRFGYLTAEEAADLLGVSGTTGRDVGVATPDGLIDRQSGDARYVQAGQPVILPTYTVAGVPSAATYARGMIYVSDESGGAVPAFSDGTNWRRVTDRAIVS